MNAFRENKYHTFLIILMIGLITVSFVCYLLFGKENPETIRISENSLAYYLLIFGLCSALYALSSLLIYLGGMSEFKPGADKYNKPKIWEWCCFGLGILLLFSSFPAAIIFGGLRSMYNKRLIRGIEKEIDEKWSERFDYAPCPHCGQTRIKKERKPWEPLD